MTDKHIHEAAAAIAAADALVVTAGAGMGVDSGLPDFRGSEGFWKAYPALAAAGIDFMAAASAPSFETHPRRAWGFYGHRLRLYRRTLPHAGYARLLDWGERKAHGISVFTSNVDGQFLAAGFDPTQVHECHGSIHYLQCTQACSDDIWPADAFFPEVDEARCELLNAAPHCPHCGALARPNILMFNDMHWVPERSAAQSQHQRAWLALAKRPVVIEIGAGTAIATVRHFGESLALHSGARLIRINLRDSAVRRPQDIGLAMPAVEALHTIAGLLG